MSFFGFLPLLQTFVGVADITGLEDFLTMHAAIESARLILIGH